MAVFRISGQRTERPLLGRIAARRLDADRAAGFAQAVVESTTYERWILVVSCSIWRGGVGRAGLHAAMGVPLEALAAADHVIAGGQGAFDGHVAANGQAAGRFDQGTGAIGEQGGEGVGDGIVADPRAVFVFGQFGQGVAGRGRGVVVET